jgi:hypothetical protein
VNGETPNGERNAVKDPETVPLNIVPLDDTALALLAEIDRDERDAAQQITGQRVGIIRMVMKQQRLEGVWGLSEDRKSIVRRQ